MTISKKFAVFTISTFLVLGLDGLGKPALSNGPIVERRSEWPELKPKDLPDGSRGNYEQSKLINLLTVGIYGQGAPGSLVILASNANDYYILTAKHVIKGQGRKEDLDVMTYDGRFHKASIVAISKKYDLALLKFISTSKSKYYSAIIEPPGQSLTNIIVSGYPVPSKGVKIVTQRKSPGSIVATTNGNEDGYDLQYNSMTTVGMSGGPVFGYVSPPRDAKGCNIYMCPGLMMPVLIGIHGRAESYEYGGKSGIALGIPAEYSVSEFAGNLRSAGIDILRDQSLLSSRLFRDACQLGRAIKEEEANQDVGDPLYIEKKLAELRNYLLSTGTDEKTVNYSIESRRKAMRAFSVYGNPLKPIHEKCKNYPEQ